MKLITKPVLFSGISLLIYLVCCFCCFYLYPPSRVANRQIWKGYYTLLFRTDYNNLQRITEHLKDCNYRFISELNETVEISNFGTKEKIRLIDLKKRFESLDPRFDNYMKKLPLFFHPGDHHKSKAVGNVTENGWKIVYIKSSKTPILFFSRLGMDLSGCGIEWHPGGGSLFSKTAPVLSGILFLLFILLFFKGRRIYYFFGALPWGILFINGDSVVITVGILLFFVWSFSLEAILLNYNFFQNYSSRNQDSARFAAVRFLYLFSFISVVIFITISNPVILPSILAGAAANIMIIGFHIFIFEIKKRKRIHTLFYQTRICPENTLNILRRNLKIKHRIAREPMGIAAAFFAAFLILVTPLMPVFFGYGDSVLIPVPVGGKKSNSFPWRCPGGSVGISENNGIKELPDICDFITHRAYQKGYFFGFPYRLPEKNEKILLSTFQLDGNLIKKSKKEFFRFSPEWLNDILSNLHSGIPLMLKNQDILCTVKYAKKGEQAVDLFSWLGCLFICLFAFAPLVFLNTYLTPEVLYDNKSSEERRKWLAA